LWRRSPDRKVGVLHNRQAAAITMTEHITPRVAILGAGSWGTALATLAASQADTWLWARDAAAANAIAATRRHPRYLTDIALPPALHATADLHAAVQHVLRAPSGLLILGVPVAGLQALCTRLAAILAQRQTQTPPATDALRDCASPAVIWTCKGIHPDSSALPHQIVERHLGHLLGGERVGLGVLSGPSFAHEVAQGLPVALTVASSQPWVAERTIAALHGPNARIYSSADVVGVEVGGALKNIMAIACGIAEGLGLGENARAALITRGLAEMQRLGLALGGQAQTFSGLTGVGDLVLTATGKSRNRQVGLAISAGQPLAHILASGMTAEGVRCARAAQALGQRHAVDMPITDAVCRVLFENVAPHQAVSELLARQARAENAA